MEKFKQVQRIKEVYVRGENIIQYLKGIDNSSFNDIEDILISYDFQAGSYIKGFSKNREFYEKYCNAIANIINNLGEIDSIIEIGVGEATTLSTVIRNMDKVPSEILGLDISWSRLKFAKELLNNLSIKANLFTANLFEIPLPDSSVDIVYTSHSIEPNGGKEEEALKELYRIAKKYLILLEPSFEFGSEEARIRMKKHNYVTEIYGTAKRLDYKIIEHRLFDHSFNPLNPTGIIIIEKEDVLSDSPYLICPVSKSELSKHSESLLYSKESYLAYPIIEEIPCLLKDNAILAVHLLTDYEKYKQENGIVINWH